MHLNWIFVAMVMCLASISGSSGHPFCLVNEKPVSYSPGDKVCCGYRLWDRTAPDTRATRACCNGQQLYDENSQICCGEKAWNIFDERGDKRECCGLNKLYRPGRNETCCGNEVFQPGHRNAGPSMGCCGGIPFNLTTKHCCHHHGNFYINDKEPGAILSCCHLMAYDRKKASCDKRTGTIEPIPRQKCLDGLSSTPYYASTHSCCSGKVVPNPPVDPTDTVWPTLDCCNEESPVVFNSNTKRCCSNSYLIPKQGDLDCCGSGFYNTTTELCCNNQAVPKKKNVANNVCCGSEAMDSEKMICCDGKTPYDTNNFKCCGNRAISKRDECCDKKVVDPKKAVCCKYDDKLINKSKAGDNACCKHYRNKYAEHVSYDSYTEDCDEDHGVVPKTPLHVNVGRIPYLPTSETVTSTKAPKPQKRKKFRHSRNLCPFQEREKMIRNSCRRKQVYKVKLIGTTLTKRGTLLNITFEDSGESRQILMPFRCNLVTGKKSRYIIATNRDLQDMATKKRLGRKDIILRNNKRTRKDRRDSCHLKKTIKGFLVS